MEGPEKDKQGKLVGLPLLAFERYIELGMSCILRLTLEDQSDHDNKRSVQVALTASQCQEMAENLMICVQVIELERPTAPQ